MLFVSTNDTKISRDQRLELQSKIMGFVREALVYDKGYVVFEVKDLSSFDFDFYYSSGSEINVNYEETKDETKNRILYTLDCSELHGNNKANDSIDLLMQYLYNYIVGFISANILFEKYGIKDHSMKFKEMDIA